MKVLALLLSLIAFSFSEELVVLSFPGELFKLKWKKYVGKKNFFDTCQPLIFGRYVLHATNGDEKEKDRYDKLYVFDEKGNLFWSFEGTDDMNGVVASPEFIAVSDDNGYVYALSWEGKVLWRFKAKKSVRSLSIGDLNEDGFPDVVAESGDNYIYALSGKDGGPLWKFKTGRAVYSSPALGDLDGDGVLDVVVGSRDHYVYALSGKDGTLLWKFKTGSGVVSSPALGDLDGDGYLDVVVGSGDSYIYALSGKDGELIWKFKTGGNVASSPALGDLDGDGNLDVVVGSWDSYVYALSGKDGRLLWKFGTDDWVLSSPALGDLDGDGYLDVVVGSWNNYIYTISGKGGMLLWKFKTENHVVSSPALGDVDGDGYLDLAVASRDGYLYLFEATRKGGRVVWSRFHGDAFGTGVYENAVSFAKANLSGKAFAWKPVDTNITLDKLYALAKKSNFSSLQKAVFKPSSNPIINKAKRKRALKLAKERAIVELKNKVAKEVKNTVERLMKEAELSDRKLAQNIYNSVLAEVLKKVDKSMIITYQAYQGKGEIYVLAVADNVIKRKEIENKIATLIAKALEGEKIKVVQRVEVPKLDIKPSKSSEITVSSLSYKKEKQESLRACVKPNPNYYFFGVVVYDYDEISNLSYVKNDKDLIYKLATCYMGVPEENIRILENPPYTKLKRELRRFAKAVRRKNSVLYFYYSGHGVLDSEGKFYILPTDASIEDETALRESGINIEELKRLLARAEGKKVAFIDACRVETRWKPAVAVYRPKLINTAMIFSTKRGELSNADKEQRYSAFTRALYEMASSGLVNLDFDNDGYVEIGELIRPLRNWVRKVSAGEQTPDVWGPKDFEIFPVE